MPHVDTSRGGAPTPDERLARLGAESRGLVARLGFGPEAAGQIEAAIEAVYGKQRASLEEGNTELDHQVQEIVFLRLVLAELAEAVQLGAPPSTREGEPSLALEDAMKPRRDSTQIAFDPRSWPLEEASTDVYAPPSERLQIVVLQMNEQELGIADAGLSLLDAVAIELRQKARL